MENIKNENLAELFKSLRAHRIVAESNDKDRAFLEYKVVLSAREYEELQKQAAEAERQRALGAGEEVKS